MIIQKSETAACFLRHWTTSSRGAPSICKCCLCLYTQNYTIKGKENAKKCLINLIQGYETNQGSKRASIIKTDIYQHRSIFP